jgi:hypothetical protein
MKAYVGVDVLIHIFLTSALVGEWSASHPSHFTPMERAPGTHWKGGIQLNFFFFLLSATARGGLWPPFSFEGFVTMIVLRGGVVNPTPNPQLSWKTNVFCRGCLP